MFSDKRDIFDINLGEDRMDKFNIFPNLLVVFTLVLKKKYWIEVAKRYIVYECVRSVLYLIKYFASVVGY